MDRHADSPIAAIISVAMEMVLAVEDMITMAVCSE